MTVPAGARIIANKFAHTCFSKDGMVGAGDGAALIDANINGGKWTTFHLACLPQPYDEHDVKPAYSGPRHPYRGPVTPEHVRCGACGCWRLDHTVKPGGAPGATTCLNTRCKGCAGWQDPSVVANTIGLVNAGLIAPSTGVVRLSMLTPEQEAEKEAEIIKSQAQSLAPTSRVAPTIVVFYGPIKSATDGDQHFIFPQQVAALHGITTDIMAETHVQFVSPEQKQTWRPPTVGEYTVVGPHYTTDEYENAKQALADWLEQRGITS